MKKLAELVKVIENNENCVLLEVKKNKSLDLIKLGCFDGNETMFRISKAPRFATHTTTVWRDTNAFSWEWGGSNTLVSEQTRKKGYMIRDCIEKDLHISINI